MFESILLVEDEAALRATLGDRLRGEGYVVDTAVDGFEAVDKAANLPFDLIILDLMLPSRSGFDVCRDIRQAGMATPILILTARDQTTDKVEENPKRPELIVTVSGTGYKFVGDKRS